MKAISYFLRFALFVCITLAAPAISLADQAKAQCDREAVPSTNGLTPCKVSWQFFDQGEDFDYWVQRLVVTEGSTEWANVFGPSKDNAGRTADHVEGGFLYRVVACGESSDNPGDCVSSTALWAPVIADNHDDIPTFLMLNDGTRVSAKSSSNPQDEPIELLNIEYNMALIQVMVSLVDKKQLPKLTELGFANVHDLPAGIAKWDAYMDFNVRTSYPIDPIDPYAPPHIP